MMNDTYYNALVVCEDLERNLDGALQALKKASNWGIVDLIGGGFITSLIKRENMKKAQGYIYNVRDLLRDLADEMQTDAPIMELDVDPDDLLGFTDIVFDNIFSDAMVQTKIEKTYSTLEKLYKENRRLMDRLKNG